MKTKKFRKWILLFLMMCFLLLTACAAPASSAAAPPATSISPQNESAPAAVSSEPAASSAAVSSAAPAEPIAYMSYDEYFSEARELDAQTGIYSQPNEPFVYRKDGRYLFPFYLPIYGYAETKTGVLALYEGKVYNVREPGQLAEVAYAPDAPYQTVSLSRNADEHCFYVINRNTENEDQYQVCRIFRPAGQADLLATEKELPGAPEYLEVYSNVEFMAVCHIKSDQRPDMTNDESMNIGSFTSRVMVINTRTGTRILGDTPEFERWVAEKDAK